MEIIETEYGYKEVWRNGDTYHYNHQGKRHHPTGPAVKFPSGFKAYYSNGVKHRTDGPALEYSDGDKEYYVNGLRHRTDGPALEYALDGDKLYFKYGKLHRTDGPAVIAGDIELHFINGKYVWKR